MERTSVETFGDYVAVGDGYAPKTLRLQADDFDFRLQFKVHDDVLWLLDKATRGEQKKPVFRLENVIVNTSDAG